MNVSLDLLPNLHLPICYNADYNYTVYKTTGFFKKDILHFFTKIFYRIFCFIGTYILDIFLYFNTLLKFIIYIRDNASDCYQSGTDKKRNNIPFLQKKSIFKAKPLCEYSFSIITDNCMSKKSCIIYIVSRFIKIDLTKIFRNLLLFVYILNINIVSWFKSNENISTLSS